MKNITTANFEQQEFLDQTDYMYLLLDDTDHVQKDT